MQFIDKYRWPIIAGIIVILLGVTLYLGGNKDTDKADNNKESSQTAKQKQAEEQKAKEEAAKTGKATVTAAEGDSYTVLARHAVAQYAKDAGVEVTPAQAVAAETFLTQGANAPELEIGQEVTINKADVASAVKKAQALSADELAGWEVYVPYVNFEA